MANITKRPEKALAIQIFATQPGKSIQQVAVEVGVDPRTMYIGEVTPSSWMQFTSVIWSILVESYLLF